ncbi:minor tail protein [Gordonia phage TinaLin]|uniref:Minor tail protein n=1 Tax=Gordonia phage TinaLin TaxID=2797324 RepID=A0A7T7GTX8_9CAUD|nr:minor tail protein [Gordonia phage TinaLin]QQM15119.1 minor tail protein [Gordonia phage TinaLin]
MATLIRFRRNTEAEASASNPVLRAGEPGFAVDTNTLKIGDGVRAWNDLPDVSQDVGGLIVAWGELSSDVQSRITSRLTQAQADALYATVDRAAALEDDLDALQAEVAGKVSRLSTNSRLYARDGNGADVGIPYAANSDPDSIPRRNAAGQLAVADPSASSHATSKNYVDGRLATKADATALASKADLVGGVIPVSQLPRVSIGETYTVESQAAMLALDVQPGDVAIRSDVDTVFMLKANPASNVGNWFDLSSSAAGGVVSVNGQTGTVNLGKADVGLGDVDNTADMDKPVSSAVASALAGKVGTSDARLTNERVPVDGSVTWDKFGTGLQTDFGNLSAKADAALPGEVVAALPASPVAGRVYLLAGA